MRYLFGNYVLDLQRYELHGAGVPIKLRRKVFQVLAYLLVHRNRVVSKQELFAHLWPDQFVGEATLTSCITTLRKALGDDGRTPRFLRTLHGQGYRFVAAVEMQEPLPADIVPHALAPPGEREGVSGNGAATRTALPPPFQPLPEGALALHETPLPLAMPLNVEHKQVTVLCGALAEALTLAARLGPEAMYHLMHAVLALAQETVQRYGGTLLQVSGEGFLALFGAPVAQEDHARRAVLSALDLRQCLRVPETLRGQLHGVALRLGLHTGPVVIGPLEYDPQRPYTAVGDTLALATRLQQQAAPDTVLVSAATYALVQAEVEGAAWAASPSDTAASPVVGYAVHGLLRRWAGVPRRGARPLSPWAGRARELALLHERLALAASGQGQVVGIAGDPGMGKSRLLAEFAHSLNGQPVTYCEGHCLAYGSATPYLPVRDLLRQLWGLPDTVAPEVLTATILPRLHTVGMASEEDTALLRQLLDVSGDPASLAVFSPQERRARTFALLRQLFLHTSQRQPLVLAVENLHWSDPTSDEWLAALVAQVGGAAILLLTTYRPGYRLPWLAHSWATQVALPPLNTSDSLAVVQAVPGAVQLSARQHQAIVAQAAGNPFFLEELTWAAVEHGDDVRPLPLPDTIQAVLAARLDRLPPEAKCLVQIAAVIGPEVPGPLLQWLAGLAEETLQRGLAHLQGAELLYETQLVPEPVYTFKHALTHEVAYGSLLHGRRRTLHAQIVEALETLAGDRQDEQVDCLAHHALRGEVWDKALLYSRQAGEKALAASAYREAVMCFEQALEALAHLPLDHLTLEQAVDLRCDLDAALLPLGQHAQRLTHLWAAEQVAVGLEDHHRLGYLYRRLANALRNTQAYESAIAYCQQAHAMATTLRDTGLQRWANLEMGWLYVELGDYRQAILYLRQLLTGLQKEQRDQSFRIAVHARLLMIRCLSELGGFAEGIAYGDEAVPLVEASARLYERLIVYWRVGYLHMRQGTLCQALPLLERAVV